MGCDGPLEKARKLIGSIVRKKEKREYNRDYKYHDSLKARLNGQQGRIHRIEEIRRQLEGL